MLRPSSYDEFEENELNSLLASVTSGVLQTTREARQQLARASGNMFLLRSLVQRLLDHVSAEGRAWVNFTDVMAVESELCRDLREGRDNGVAGYIRDALNDADDISDWKPNAAMPLAIALAETSLAGTALPKLANAAREKLAQWYDSIPTQKTSRLVYDQKQLEEHLATLVERRIFQRNEFTSWLLQNWLGGYRERNQDSKWNSLLVRAAIRKVKAPELRLAVNGAEGAQAHIWAFTREDKKFAYRLSELRTDEERASATGWSI